MMISPLEIVASLFETIPSRNAAQYLIQVVQSIAPFYFIAGIACVTLAGMFEILQPLSVYGRLFSKEAIMTKLQTLRFLLPLFSMSLNKGIAFTLFYFIGFIVNLFALYFSQIGSYPQWSSSLLTAYQLHLARRVFECLFVHRFSTSSRMPILLFLAGAGHYLFTSFTLLPVSSRPEPHLYQYHEWIDPEDIVEGIHGEADPDQLVISIGVLLFVFGNLMQWIAHNDLAALRFNKDPEEKELYPLPTQVLFKYSLSPHYTAEIAIYIGLTIAKLGLECQSGYRFDSGSVPFYARFNLLLATMWVFANLTVTAVRTKSWYAKQAKSEEDRKRIESTAAIMPYLL